MNYRITEGIKKNKKVIIIGLVLWILLTIVLVLPFTIAKGVTTTSTGIDLAKFIQVFGEAISNPAKSIRVLFKTKQFGALFSNWFFITIVYIIFFIIGFVRTMPKHQYDNIEHGSSDWSQRGEQYRILSNKKGIILGENNYLTEIDIWSLGCILLELFT